MGKSITGQIDKIEFFIDQEKIQMFCFPRGLTGSGKIMADKRVNKAGFADV
jgi:hypothetical protein